MAAGMAGGTVGSTMTAAKPYVVDEQPTAPSHHRAMYGLRKGHFHKALGLEDGASITADHITRGKTSANPHVKAMADLAE